MSNYLNDKNAFLATEQAVTGTAVTGTGKRLGENLASVKPCYLVTEVTTEFVDGTGTSTMTIDIQASDSLGSGYSSIGISSALDMDGYAVGDTIVQSIPATNAPYLRVVYTPGSVGAYTAGKVSSFVTPAVAFGD